MGADDRALADEADLPSLVLQPADLPNIFVRFDEGALARREMPGGDRADPLRFGREGGWKARYKRSGTVKTRGPVVIESRVDLFKDADGAEQDFEAYKLELRAAEARHPSPKLGDEAIALGHVEPALRPVQFFTVAWRQQNVTASVTVNGFAGKLLFADVVALARRQHRRITAAQRD